MNDRRTTNTLLLLILLSVSPALLCLAGAALMGLSAGGLVLLLVALRFAPWLLGIAAAVLGTRAALAAKRVPPGYQGLHPDVGYPAIASGACVIGAIIMVVLLSAR